MKNIRTFYLNFFQFLVVKFSVYLNRPVFVMITINTGLLKGSVLFLLLLSIYKRISKNSFLST